jgi:hypothetical protein
MALAGVGAAFKRSATDSSASTYAAIGEVNSITGPNMSREFIDTTALDTSGGYRTFIPSFRDGGEITLDVNFERIITSISKMISNPLTGRTIRLSFLILVALPLSSLVMLPVWAIRFPRMTKS